MAEDRQPTRRPDLPRLKLLSNGNILYWDYARHGWYSYGRVYKGRIRVSPWLLPKTLNEWLSA